MDFCEFRKNDIIDRTAKMSWHTNVLSQFYSILERVFYYVPLDCIYYLAKTHFYKFPAILGGYENGDKRWICARLLNLPTYDIADSMLENACARKFDEIIWARVYVILAILLTLSLREVWKIIWDLIRRQLMTDEKRLELERERTTKLYEKLVDKMEKDKKKKEVTPKSEDSKRKSRETLLIRDACFDMTKSICVILDMTISDEVKLEEIRKVLSQANPLVKERIPSKLIGSSSSTTALVTLKDE